MRSELFGARLFAVLILFSGLCGSASAETPTGAAAHQQAYQAALDAVMGGPDRIAGEMLRIRSGEVEHYDFLQYEHIELIRHARALAYPPDIPDREGRLRTVELADAVLQAANDLEWIIADFLRAHALEQISERHPDQSVTGNDPDPLIRQVRRSGVLKSAELLQRHYREVKPASP